MAAARKPGPIGTDGEVVDVNDGTLVRNPSPLPGPCGHQPGAAVTHVRISIHRQWQPPRGLPSLEEGVSGPYVRWLQILLNEHAAANPPLKVDGYFGPKTLVAVRAFQRLSSLFSDGVVGQQTWLKLVAPGASSEDSGVRAGFSAPSNQLAKQQGLVSVADWPLTQRFEKVLSLAPQHMAPELATQFRAMLTPGNIAVAAGTLAVWAVSQAFGIGEVVDAILLVVGAAFVGLGIFKAGEDLGDCLVTTLEAQGFADLDRAADSLAEAVVILGVTAFFALLAKMASKFTRGSGAAEQEAAGSSSAAAGGDAAPKPPATPKRPRPAVVDEPEPPVPPEPNPLKLAQSIRNSPEGSAERAQLVDQFAKMSTHVKEPANRVVLGKWAEGGGYVAEAQKNGGVWYETPDGTYPVLGKEAAWETNEAFLKQQMSSGVPKLEFTGMSEDQAASQLADLEASGQPIESAPARIREFDFMQKNAANYGYVQQGMIFTKVP